MQDGSALVSPAIIGSFRTFVFTLIQLNEVLSCFNGWIITPRLSELEPPGTDLPVTTIITTVTYAALEPVFTRELQLLAVQPFVLLLVFSPVHLICSLSSVDINDWARGTAQQQLEYAAPLGTDTASLPGVRRWRKGAFEHRLAASTLLLPVCTSAIINSALLLLAQCLQASSLLQQNPSTVVLLPVSVVAYLGCRHGDYALFRQTQRGQSLGRQGSRRWIWAISCQVLLVAIRTVVRRFVGLASLEAFRVPDLIEAEQNFGLQRYLWIEDAIPYALRQTLWILVPTSFACMLVGRYFMAQAIDKTSQGSRESSSTQALAKE